MAEVIAYRVLDPDTARGPYAGSLARSKELTDQLVRAHNGSPSHPVRQITAARCACPTLEDLREWFQGFWSEIRNAGYELWEIEGPEVIKSYYVDRPEGIPQVLVAADDLKHRRLIDIPEDWR